jgi:hypothetical protein
MRSSTLLLQLLVLLAAVHVTLPSQSLLVDIEWEKVPPTSPSRERDPKFPQASPPMVVHHSARPAERRGLKSSFCRSASSRGRYIVTTSSNMRVEALEFVFTVLSCLWWLTKVAFDRVAQKIRAGAVEAEREGKRSSSEEVLQAVQEAANTRRAERRSMGDRENIRGGEDGCIDLHPGSGVGVEKLLALEVRWPRRDEPLHALNTAGSMGCSNDKRISCAVAITKGYARVLSLTVQLVQHQGTARCLCEDSFRGVC